MWLVDLLGDSAVMRSKQIKNITSLFNIILIQIGCLMSALADVFSADAVQGTEQARASQLPENVFNEY